MATVEFHKELLPEDPSNRPCTIIGKAEYIKKIGYGNVSKFLEPRVNEETWNLAVERLSVSSNGSCNLWLDKASVAGLSNVVSRHNTPSVAHFLVKMLQAEKKSGEQTAVVVVCRQSEVFASGCAVARCFPRYTRVSHLQSKKAASIVQVTFLVIQDTGDTSAVADMDIQCLNDVCKAIRFTQEIVDAPCNEMHTDAFLDRVREVGAELSITPLIIQGRELEIGGFGGIYGVGKAAIHQPALAVLSHTPPGATKTICWVGKGIVYDTGGLSLKAPTSMPGMKRDCGGAAGILGAFYVAVKQGFTQNLHAVFCLAENSVGPLATRPDDIHKLYSGKTVEINNTDAEGRLVLGDGVAYARKDLKADCVLDMATLTGAQGIATGKYHAAVLCNTEEGEKAAVEAGRQSGDMTFPLCYCPELHFSEFNSVVADMKNSVASRDNAQSSCAGLFIGAHLGTDYEGTWIHVDMAAPVYSGERATGYGVALLSALFGKCSGSSLLNTVAPPMDFY
eukprot:Em0018g151a